MAKANLRKQLEAMLDEDERIEAVVLGVHYDDPNKWYNDKEPANHPEAVGRMLTWDDAAPILDENYDNGYGGAECWPFYAWTSKFVYFVHEYDGATSIHRIPRHPVDCKADFDGAYE